MRKITTPMVSGLDASFLLELLVFPALYFLWKVDNLLCLTENAFRICVHRGQIRAYKLGRRHRPKSSDLRKLIV